MNVLLPWERLLWSGRPVRFTVPRAGRVRYLLTDFRLVRVSGGDHHEIAIADIAEVHRSASRCDRLLGASTLVVTPRNARREAIVLHGVRRGAQFAALLELLAGDPRAHIDADAVAAALAWEPRGGRSQLSEALAAAVIVAMAMFGVAISLHGTAGPITYSATDAIYPNGHKQDRDTIVRFMNDDVMPWARTAIGPLVGGADRVRCETCHGRDAESRGWRMPGVSALPLADVRERGWEQYSGGMDEQMRNAIYGYLAEPDKQAKAARMREVVMPGMARLLRRQPYDFTRPYDFNRQRAAFGCYHCHKVK